MQLLIYYIFGEKDDSHPIMIAVSPHSTLWPYHRLPSIHSTPLYPPPPPLPHAFTQVRSLFWVYLTVMLALLVAYLFEIITWLILGEGHRGQGSVGVGRGARQWGRTAGGGSRGGLHATHHCFVHLSDGIAADRSGPACMHAPVRTTSCSPPLLAQVP